MERHWKIGPRNTEKLMGRKSLKTKIRSKKILFYFFSAYRYYEGHTPVLVTSDIELIDEIYYKQFSNFSARKVSFHLS